jgi:hypothetical protein
LEEILQAIERVVVRKISCLVPVLIIPIWFGS